MFILFPYKQVSGIYGNHEWFKMTNASYYVIYYERFRKVMQRTEKEAFSGHQKHSILVLETKTAGHPGDNGNGVSQKIQKHTKSKICQLKEHT